MMGTHIRFLLSENKVWKSNRWIELQWLFPRKEPTHKKTFCDLKDILSLFSMHKEMRRQLLEPERLSIFIPFSFITLFKIY